MDVIEQPYGRQSTQSTRQVSTETGTTASARLPIADAVLDRLLHGAHRPEQRGESAGKLTAGLAGRNR